MKRVMRIDALHMEQDEHERIYPVFIGPTGERFVPVIDRDGNLSWEQDIKK